MKLMHISDLHIGKRLMESSLADDQRYILSRITDIARGERPDAVLIAGDVYDRSVPAEEAVGMLDGFLTSLAELRTQVFIISGNHDSPERLSFASRLISLAGIHIAPVYGGTLEPYTLSDEWGEVRIWMLPFVKPSQVRRCFPDADISDYTSAVRTAIQAAGIDVSKRNVLLAHQFVTGAALSESEEMTVGTLENISSSVFDGIDYVALGHIHRPQSIGREGVRYSGTPLRYSFAEADQEKSVTIAELGPKGSLSVRAIPLEPLHGMRVIRGSFSAIWENGLKLAGGDPARTDFVQIVLTDENDVPDAMARLRQIYGGLLKLVYDNTRTRMRSGVGPAENAAERTPLELFAGLYEKQNGQPMSAEQEELVSSLIEEIWGGESLKNETS